MQIPWRIKKKLYPIFTSRTKDGKVFYNHLYDYFEECVKEGHGPYLKHEKEIDYWDKFIETYHPELLLKNKED